MTKQAMPVADALADAETLRWFAQKYFVHSVYDPVYAGISNGRAAFCYAREGNPDEAFRCAVWAASSAFRAVPGLRGE